MMRILLIDPPGKNKGLNTGLGYLSAMLREKHEVSVLDLNNREIGRCGDPNPEMTDVQILKDVNDALESFQPDLLGVSVKTFTAETAKNIINFAKAKRPEMFTIVGGPHITLDGYNFIIENNIDLGIQGEGEYKINELCTALEKNNRLEKIDGIYFWKNKKLIHNPKIKNIGDLDALPYPYYGDFSSVKRNGGSLGEYPILTSRGCPYKCAYCSMPKIMGNKWRSHSPERVFKELLHAQKAYNSTSFTVVDDNLTLNLKRVENICDMLISERLGLPWNSQNGIRADRISENLAQKMKKSGCQFVWIGIESADETVFNKINKGEKLEDIKRGARHLKQAGIKVGGFFIIGLPYSNRETDLKSVDFVKKNMIEGWWFNFVPYPHTESNEWVKKHGKFLRSTDGALQFGTNSIEPVFETEDYTKESRILTYNEIHVRLKLFDRLGDSSLKQWDRWKAVFKMIVPFGFGAIASFLIFVLKYNARLIVRNILS